MRLTDITVRELKAPKRGQKFYADDVLAGFGVRVSQGGTKSFVLVHGPRRQRVTIGRYPIITLADARTEAKRRSAEIILGKFKPRSISFEDAKRRFLEACEAKNRARTVADYRRLLKHFPFGKTQLSQISRHDIAQRLDKLRKTPSETNHALVAVKVFFRWTERQGFLESNPCGALRAQQAMVARDRVLTERELAEVLRLAMREPYPFGPIVTLLVLTGLRRGEVAAMRWSWIDLQNRTITVPAEIAKNRRQHVLPFGDLALEVLQSVPNMGDLLFPASRSHVRGRLTSVYNGWPKAKVSFDKKLNCVAHYTLHDLRRTFSSQLASLGTPIHVTEKLLNHVSGTVSGVAAVYNRYSYAPEMRAAVEAYETRLKELLDKSA
jgi:integrase